MSVLENHTKAQEEVDARIRVLELETFRLKRHRNSLSLISQLPSEILQKIFWHSLIFLGLSRSDRVRPMPDCIKLCHVSHSWREIALGHAPLWTTIQVRMRTHLEQFEFMWHNAGAAPIHLDIGDKKPSSKCQEFTSGVIEAVVKNIQKEPHRLHSLGIYYGNEGEMKHIISGISGTFEQLETLELISHLDPSCGGTTGLMSIAAPKLRNANFAWVDAPWRSPILNAVNLTRLYCEIKSGNSDFSPFLRGIAGTLQELDLKGPSYRSEVANFVGAAIEGPPVRLGSLRRLGLYMRPELMSSLAQHIQFDPAHFSSLDLGKPTPDLDQHYAHHVWSTVEAAFSGIQLRPQEVHFERDGSMTAWKDSPTSTGSHHWHSLYLFLPEYLFSERETHRNPFTYSNLEVLVLSAQVRLSDWLWTRLSESQSLKEIRLAGNLYWESSLPASLMVLKRPQPNNGPFPALERFISHQMPSIQPGSRATAELVPPLDNEEAAAEKEYALNIIDALKERRRLCQTDTLLSQVSFGGCKYDLQEEVEQELRKEAVDVTWTVNIPCIAHVGDDIWLRTDTGYSGQPPQREDDYD